MTTSIRHPWVPAVGAVAGTALAVKAAVIIGSGNAVPEQPMAVLYLFGIAVGVIAGIGLGLRRRSVWQRLLVGVAAPLFVVAWIIGLGELVEPLVGTVSDEQYVRDETPVGLLGLGMLAASYVGFRHDQRAGLVTREAAVR